MDGTGGRRGRVAEDGATNTIKVVVTITSRDKDYLRRRGDGNVSLGLRKLIAESRGPALQTFSKLKIPPARRDEEFDDL